MLKHGILGLLNYGEMTGYEIMMAFRDSLQFFWMANTSRIKIFLLLRMPVKRSLRAGFEMKIMENGILDY